MSQKVQEFGIGSRRQKLGRSKTLHPTLFEKSNFCPKIQFWQNPNIFNPIFFWHFFSWNQSCQQLKSPKPQHFHEFFTQKNRQFSQEIKVEFLDKIWRFRTVWFRSEKKNHRNFDDLESSKRTILALYENFWWLFSLTHSGNDDSWSAIQFRNSAFGIQLAPQVSVASEFLR